MSSESARIRHPYWHFYWPLAITGLSMVLISQFQNGALARFPDAVEELAIFAYASSIYRLPMAMLGFAPIAVNRMGRSSHNRAVCFRFIMAVAAVLTLPLVVLGFTGAGRSVVRLLFTVDARTLDAVQHYLRLLAPLVFVNALRFFFNGLLVQARRTKIVTLLDNFLLVCVAVILVVGYRHGWGAVRTLSLAQLLSSALTMALAVGSYRLWYVKRETQYDKPLTYADAFRYFYPMALTSGMFSISRPILYSFVSRVPGSTPVVAALRVGFDLGMVFHMPLNQFRHLFVTFGLEHMRGIRRFMVRIIVVVTALILLVAGTPLCRFIYGSLLGVTGVVRDMACQILWVVAGIPFIASVRNYYHGIALIKRRTVKMALGALGRTLTILGGSWMLYSSGRLGHLQAAAVLLAGFAAETAVVMVASVLEGN